MLYVHCTCIHSLFLSLSMHPLFGLLHVAMISQNHHRGYHFAPKFFSHYHKSRAYTHMLVINARAHSVISNKISIQLCSVSLHFFLNLLMLHFQWSEKLSSAWAMNKKKADEKIHANNSVGSRTDRLHATMVDGVTYQKISLKIVSVLCYYLYWYCCCCYCHCI